MENYRDKSYFCDEEKSSSCSTIACQTADVNVSIDLQPKVHVGKIVTECCGVPKIEYYENQDCYKNCKCEIVVTQTLRIKIPIEFSAEAETMDSCIICKKP